MPSISDSATESMVTITYEDQDVDMNRPREWRYTDESQKALFPGDRAFEYVTTIHDREIKWGRA